MKQLYMLSASHRYMQRHPRISIDIQNAFGTMSRAAMGEDFMDTFPALSTLVSILLSTATPLLWEDVAGTTHEIQSHIGLDQGCPL